MTYVHGHKCLQGAVRGKDVVAVGAKEGAKEWAPADVPFVGAIGYAKQNKAGEAHKTVV